MRIIFEYVPSNNILKVEFWKPRACYENDNKNAWIFTNFLCSENDGACPQQEISRQISFASSEFSDPQTSRPKKRRSVLEAFFVVEKFTMGPNCTWKNFKSFQFQDFLKKDISRVFLQCQTWIVNYYVRKFVRKSQ